ncbi:hypothetical protein B0O99DRAFT_682959 [Bisporella sp. PMI_857]|nr:hypothetical protein B0O99DRAFT_682959 [Bisporella sp. PMI_857]
MIFRCVKIRVELNKGWQQTPNSFNVQSHKRLRELRELNNQGKSSVGGSPQDCSICLNAIAPCQSLFVAPCSHTWHYKCIRVIINGPHWPHFICPNCRTVADLEAEIDDPSADGEWEQLEAEEAEAPAAPAAPAQASSNDQSRSRRHIDSSEQTYVTPQASAQETGTENSDGEVVEASDESDEGQHISDTAEAMGYLNINETDNPSASSASSETPEASSATVRPVDIVRKPVAALGGSTSQFEQTPRQNHDRLVRTPSPGGYHHLYQKPLSTAKDP